MKKVKFGDIFEIPIHNGKKGFGQYVYLDKKQGPLIQVYQLVVDQEVKMDPEVIITHPLMFPPIITGIFAAVKSGEWKVIGNIQIPDFSYPKFVSTYWDDKTGKARVWFLWDGLKSSEIGWELPDEYKSLEFLIVWNPKNVVKRIELGGQLLYPYKDLIEKNRFDPQKPE